MRYDLSLAGDTFTPAREAFDRALLATLRKMRKQDIQEGSVSLKVSIELWKRYPIGPDGKEKELFTPVFDHEVNSQIVQKDKTSGTIDKDFVLTIGKDGMPKMYSQDTDNLFDMVAREEGKRDDEAVSSDG